MKNILLVMVVLAVLSAMIVSATQFGAEAPIVSVNGNDITITGTFIDAPDVSNVQLKCNDNIVATSPVIDGAYTIKTVFGGFNGCEQGEATIMIGDTQISINLQKQAWAVTETGGGKNEAGASLSGFTADSVNAPGVPEFSILTLGLAIAGVGLGLAFLRKP
jgi:hypothetical protein